MEERRAYNTEQGEPFEIEFADLPAPEEILDDVKCNRVLRRLGSIRKEIEAVQTQAKDEIEAIHLREQALVDGLERKYGWLFDRYRMLFVQIVDSHEAETHERSRKYMAGTMGRQKKPWVGDILDQAAAVRLCREADLEGEIVPESVRWGDFKRLLKVVEGTAPIFEPTGEVLPEGLVEITMGEDTFYIKFA